MSTQNGKQRVTIGIEKVKELLANGYSRTTSSKNHDPNVGSIEEYYDISKAQVKRLFDRPELKGLKTKKVDVIINVVAGMGDEPTPTVTAAEDDVEIVEATEEAPQTEEGVATNFDSPFVNV